MEDIFKQIINETVKPLLKDGGFNKKTLNFYKNDNGLIFLINIQKSHGNSSTELGFYINCAIHSHVIDEELGEKINEFPKEYQCQFNERIEEISKKAPEEFIINSSTNVESLQKLLKESLEDTLKYFSKITDTKSFVQFMSKNGTRQEDEVFRYCVRKGFNDDARALAEYFHKSIDAERWEDFFADRFLEILEEENSSLEIECLK